MVSLDKTNRAQTGPQSPRTKGHRKTNTIQYKSDEEKLHSMLNEEFWGVDVDEESGLVYGPFKHAFKCIAKYVAAAWKIRNAYAHPSDVA